MLCSLIPFHTTPRKASLARFRPHSQPKGHPQYHTTHDGCQQAPPLPLTAAIRHRISDLPFFERRLHAQTCNRAVLCPTPLFPGTGSSMVTSPMVGSAGRPEAAAVASHDAAEAEGQNMNGPSAVSPSNRATGSLARRALSSPTTAPVSPNSAPLHRPHSFLDLAAPATAPVVAQRHGRNLTHRNICRPDYVSSGTAGAVPPAAAAAAAAAAPAPDRSATVSRRKRRTGASPLLDEADEPSAKRQKAANALMEVGGNRAPQWHDDHAATADLIEAALDHAMAATRDQPVATHRGPAGPSAGVDRNPALAAHAARRHNNSIRSELAIRSADPTTTAAAAAAAAVSLSFAPASGSGLVDGGTSAPSASPPTNNPHLATTAATAAAMSTSPSPSSSAPSSDNNRNSNTNTNRNDDTGDAGDLDDRDAPAPATPFEFVPHLSADLGQVPPDWDGSLLSSCLAFLLPKLPTSGSSAAAAAVNRLLAELAKFAPDQAPPGAADPSRPPRLRDVSLLANRMAVFVKLISLARLTYRQRLALVEFARYGLLRALGMRVKLSSARFVV